MIETNTDLKRWTVLDRLTGQIHDLTDKQFYEGIQNNMIELRGKFVQVEGKHKVWADGFYKDNK